MRIGSLFSGYGGLDLGVQAALGGTVAWHSEVDKDANTILEHRFPGVPNLGDITAVDWESVEPVDVMTGGFPCQDLSHAGKRAGLRPGTRSGLWSHMAYAVEVLRPSLVVAENVRGLLSAEAHSDLERDCWCVGDEREPALRALGAVLGDLADIGYDAAWCGLRAADVGAPHGRFRVFLVAYPLREGLEGAYQAAGQAAQGGRQGEDGGGQRPAGRGEPAADAAQPARRGTQPDHLAPASGRAAEPGERPSHADAWGPYAGAVHRWERILGRPAPAPTEPGRSGPRLSPRFVEWMMGLPGGWVCDVPISRNAQLKALGNGVVPQQAEAALRWLLGGQVVGPALAVVARSVSDGDPLTPDRYMPDSDGGDGDG